MSIVAFCINLTYLLPNVYLLMAPQTSLIRLAQRKPHSSTTCACNKVVPYMTFTHSMFVYPSGQLTPEDVNELREALYEASAKWYDIGVGLQLSTGKLDTIRADFLHVADCLREMCSHWLRRINPRPSWEALTVVLESPPVGEGHLARQLRDKYCRGRKETIPHIYPTPGPSLPCATPTSQGYK